MLIFWSLVRNSVVLAVYLLFSVACFFTVHEHYRGGCTPVCRSRPPPCISGNKLRLHSPHSCASSSKRRSSRRWVEIYCRQFLMTALCAPPFLCAAFLVSTTRLQKSNGTGQSACSCSQHGKTSIKHSLFSLTVSQFFHYSQDIDNKCKGWLPLQERAGL